MMSNNYKKNMRRNTLSLLSCFIALAAYQPAPASDGLCGTLRAFADSVGPGETRVLKFHTIVGGNFKDREGPASAAKRCDYASYEPGKAVCTYLMQYGSISFAGRNAKAAVECLSKKTRFDLQVEVQALSVSLAYGAQDRGSRINVEFQENNDVGGMVLTIKADGSSRSAQLNR